MAGIKQLAGQTMWYGLSSIAARFINYLLTPFLTYTLANASDYGKMGLIYSAIPILNVVFTYGFETAYFRFATREEYKKTIYDTTFLSLLVSTLVLTVFLWFNQHSLGWATGLSDIPQIIQISIFIIALDTLSTIPFARLRQQGRPIKFAFVKITGILVCIFFTWFFIAYCPQQLEKHKPTWVVLIYNPNTNPIVYIVLANLFQSIITLVFLINEIASIRFRFNLPLWKEMMTYALPLVIVGMGGVINETFDRLMLRFWLPGTVTFREEQVGIYNACYKLSILITLFVQAFKMGAEPFFFKQAEGSTPQKVYARVMKFFVITLCVMYLVVSLYMPIWKHFIKSTYWAGLNVVPILLFANMFIGIYYNLSVWYKLSEKTIAGAWITLIGAVITIVFNFLFIRFFSFTACAWATFFCYGTMMVLSFVWGQKAYRIPYAWKKLVAYMVIVAILYGIYSALTAFFHPLLFCLIIATMLLAAFVFFILIVEKKEMQKLPVVGRFVR